LLDKSRKKKARITSYGMKRDEEEKERRKKRKIVRQLIEERS
jgi:hypothetical protein